MNSYYAITNHHVLFPLSPKPNFFEKARLSNVVEADPDVSAAMDILSFALYHENTKVVGDGNATIVSPDLGPKRRREEAADLTDSSDEGEHQRRRRAIVADDNAPVAPQVVDALATLKAAVYAEVTRSLEDSISINDICVNVQDRGMVDRAIRSLEDDGKIMRSEDEVYLID